ncbi:MAG TPA: hypothetical protein VNZ26_25790 [Vicinamibacterales bacterium]|nr:hypothetical protein [Vicinamibacterales bacterium]
MLDPKLQHLIDIGVAHPQTFSPLMRQLALETDPHDIRDPRHVLNIGSSDAMAGHDSEADFGMKAAKRASKKARKRATKKAKR